MGSVLAGAGLMGIRKLKPPALGYILCLVLIGLTLVLSIPSRQNTYYYHMIDEEDYQSFVWIRDNTSDNYETAILDPWKATAFTAITQKKVFSRIHAYPTAKDETARNFLEHGCDNISIMKDNGVSIVYNPFQVV